MNKFEVKPLLKQIKNELYSQLEVLNQAPSLALLLGKEEPDAVYYANSIIKKGNKLGIFVKLFSYKNKDEYYSLLKGDLKNYDGILALSPYSDDITSSDIENIPYEKDVDSFNSFHLGNLFTGKSNFAPATALSAFEIAKYHFNNNLKGKKVVIVGRSLRVGKPLIPLFLSEHATVTVCHSRTIDLAKETQSGDIVVCAIGKGNFFDASMFKNGQLIIDVGINKVNDMFVGDVDIHSIENSDLDLTITPVPGGVGSLTSYLIFKNLLYLVKHFNS